MGKKTRTDRNIVVYRNQVGTIKINHSTRSTSYQRLEKNRNEFIYSAITGCFLDRLSMLNLGGTSGLEFHLTNAFLFPDCTCLRLYIMIMHRKIPTHLASFGYLVFFSFITDWYIHVTGGDPVE